MVLNSQLSQLPLIHNAGPTGDWLVHAQNSQARVYKTSNADEIVLTNGLVSRTFRLAPNVATVSLQNLKIGEEMVRAASSEGVLTLDGKAYNLGGLHGQPDLAYLTPEWLNSLKADPNDFGFTGFQVGTTEKRMPWKRTRHSQEHDWPPKGTRLTLHFQAPASLGDVRADVFYELYDNCPIFQKSITVYNLSGKPIHLDSFAIEKLRMVEIDSEVDTTSNWTLPNITVLSDYTFGGAAQNDNNRFVYWDEDKDYTTQVNYNLETPCILRIAPALGPAADIKPGGIFQTFHAITVVHDNRNRERQGLAIRQAYRILAPWTTENPIMLHLTSTDPATVHTAMDQAAAVGFEMVIFSFGSGLDMEDVSPANIAKYKAFADYAHSKGLQVGGYSLLASRHISEQDDVINPKTGKIGGAIFGDSPCLGSKWGLAYFEHIKVFLEGTGFDLLEHDGSYPGDRCASTNHSGHKGLEDSQWNQFQIIAEFYNWCRQKGIFLNVPDNYMFSGSNKTGMWYRETNWSLPRAQQHIHARQNLFDGTWVKPPTMGWMFVPLLEYQGGGAAATVEPLHEHLADYEKHLINNLAYGAQACYRGPRLYDTPETEALVAKWVTWFKAHRDILESDVIHIRRADGTHIDGVLHVNPTLNEKGLAVFWNPSDKDLQETIRVPLYYTGLGETAHISQEGGTSFGLKIDRDYSVPLHVHVPANGFTWFVIK
jgi:hypothetical protein